MSLKHRPSRHCRQHTAPDHRTGKPQEHIDLTRTGRLVRNCTRPENSPFRPIRLRSPSLYRIVCAEERTGLTYSEIRPRDTLLREEDFQT